MKRKRSEESLGKMMRLYNYRADKGRDRGYIRCPQCHETVEVCPHCEKDMLMKKAKSRLDYLIMFEWTEVECKQGTETWSLHDFTKAQETLIKKSIPENNSPRWLFLEIGDGRAPKGKEAYLIDFPSFLTIRLIEEGKNRKSVRFRKTERSRLNEARYLFGSWALTWETGAGWTIPDDHIFWKMMKAGLELTEVAVTEKDTSQETIDEKEIEPDEKQQPAAAPARLEMLEIR